MTPDQKRARVVALFDEVVNAHDETAIARFTRSPQIEATLHQLLAGFPALHFDVIWTIAEADRVVAFIDMPGTHEAHGSWFRSPPTGRREPRSCWLCTSTRRAWYRQLAGHKPHRDAGPTRMGSRTRRPASAPTVVTRPDTTTQGRTHPQPHRRGHPGLTAGRPRCGPARRSSACVVRARCSNSA